jgi:hypothetical protein
VAGSPDDLGDVRILVGHLFEHAVASGPGSSLLPASNSSCVNPSARLPSACLA